MPPILNIDEPNSLYQYNYGRFLEGHTAMVLTGKTRDVITGFIHKNRKATF